jgi:pimeloyl-ACP methyl ester carboxylesterase
MIPWALLLAKSGYRVMLVDLRGHGASTGDIFSGGKYESADLKQLLDYLIAQRGCDGKVGVLGISFGADLGLLWAARDSRVRTVVAIAPYDQPDLAFERFVKAIHVPVPSRSLQHALALAAEQLEIKWSDYSGVNAVEQIPGPVFLIGAGKDTISPPADLQALEKAAPAGSAMLTIPDANHFIVGYCFQDLAEPVENWFDAHLPAVAVAPMESAQDR